MKQFGIFHIKYLLLEYMLIDKAYTHQLYKHVSFYTCVRFPQDCHREGVGGLN